MRFSLTIRVWQTGLMIFLLALPSIARCAEGELLLFPSVTASHRSNIVQGNELKRSEAEPAADILFSGDSGSLHYLAEFFALPADSELARLQAGWQAGQETTVWLGKFHNLQGYWNTQFHHGTYLQTSISEPGVIEDDGPLPTHYMGLQMDSNLALGSEGKVNYTLGVGKSALLDGKLKSPDILNPGRDGKLTAALRLSYSIEEGEPTQVGVFAATNRIPVKDSTLSEIRQTVWGVFGNWENDKLRLIGEFYSFRNELAGASGIDSGTFLNAYVQGEYRFAPKFTLYGRTEGTSRDSGDAYLALLPDFVDSRNMMGLRYEVAKGQAIKLEASHVRRLDDHFNQLQLQWSAVFP